MYQRFCFLLVALACFISFEAHAQLAKNFQPLSAYTGQDEELIKGLRQQMRDELATLPSKTPVEFQIRNRYFRNTESLIRRVRRKAFIKDELMRGFVDSVFNDLVSHTKLKSKPRRVLVTRLPYGNAMCMGEGTFLITTGLLGKITNESQLAFTLAHEIAHYELGHVRQRIIQDVTTMYGKKLTQGVKNILQNYHSTDEMEMDSLRRMVYAMSEFTRKQELEADSLGFIIQRNASYNTRESVTMLAVLDSIDYTKDRLGYALFGAFQFAKYPFKPEWLRDRPDYYYDKSENVFIFSKDSVQSHPEMTLRMNALRAMHGNDTVPLNKRSDAHLREVLEMAQFEDVDITFRARRFAYALLMALQLKQSYPQNSYLVATIGKILMTQISPDSKLSSGTGVPAVVSAQGQELRMVSAFLYNLKPQEAGELAFHFLNTQKNFNPEDAEHYFLLYLTCQATGRENVADKIRDSFKERFAGTKSYKLYIEDMRKPSAARSFMDYFFRPANAPSPSYRSKNF